MAQSALFSALPTSLKRILPDMVADHFIKFPSPPVEPAAGLPAGWTIVAGEPVARGARHYTADDGSALAGWWSCTPGSFSVVYDKWEFCHMLSGRCTITPKGGAPVDLGPGDGFILEPGFEGTWTVHETMTKHFVFKLAPA